MSIKILIIDDEEDITKMLKNFLEIEGFEVDTCNDPTKAMSFVEKEHYSVVMTDIKMPQMSGLDLLKQIKAYDGLTQVIVMTGFVTMENILTAFRRGANNVFFKPFENMDLLKKEIDFAVSRMDRVRQVLKELASSK
ncbi:MAG: response regulator [Deltaproteobacteria bacterium]|nr:response regulator [Deltaproteobacteria bacterium]